MYDSYHLSITNMTLVYDSGSSRLTPLQECLEILPATPGVSMVFTNMVDERLPSAVVFVAQCTGMPCFAVCGLMLQQMALVHCAEVTVFATIKLACVFPHMGIQVT